MGCSVGRLLSDDVIKFRNLPANTSLDDLAIPETSDNRKATDKLWLIVLAVGVVLLIPFLVYTLKYSHIGRVFHGVDKCGNVCGFTNPKWEGIACSGQDFTSKPYLQHENGTAKPVALWERECVESCREDYSPTEWGICVRRKVKSSESPFAFSTIATMQEIFCVVLSLMLTFLAVFLFSRFVYFIVWGVLFALLVIFAIWAAVSWYIYLTREIMIVAPIISSVFLAVMGLCILCWRRKIKLFIILFEEAIAALLVMPLLITIPIIYGIVVMVLIILLLVTTAYMFSAGTLQHVERDFYDYQRNAVMIFSMVYNIFVFSWLIRFLEGIRCMAISGAVSKWYFTRDKSALGSPIVVSIKNTFFFHLGTAAVGSLMLVLVSIIKFLILLILKTIKAQKWASCCFEPVNELCRFLSEYAYIVTGIHGQPFFKSAKRGLQLITENLVDIIAVKAIGKFVIFMTMFLIVIITIVLSDVVFSSSKLKSFSDYLWLAVLIVLVIQFILNIFQLIIDTIFICYCEDKVINTGQSKPPYWSPQFSNFLGMSKEVYGGIETEDA